MIQGVGQAPFIDTTSCLTGIECVCSLYEISPQFNSSTTYAQVGEEFTYAPLFPSFRSSLKTVYSASGSSLGEIRSAKGLALHWRPQGCRSPSQEVGDDSSRYKHIISGVTALPTARYVDMNGTTVRGCPQSAYYYFCHSVSSIT